MNKSGSNSSGEDVNHKLNDDCEEVHFPSEIKYCVNTVVPKQLQLLSEIIYSISTATYVYTLY